MIPHSIITEYRAALERLKRYSAQNFSDGTPVWVHSERYQGPGVVVKLDEAAVDYLQVMLPGGKVLYCRIEFVRHRTPEDK